MNKLNFEIYTYGDPYLQVITDDKNAYTIEQADKFELRYTEYLKDTILLGRYDTIYEVLDAANTHAAQQEDKYVMPLPQELEVFEDNQPDRPRRTRFLGRDFGPLGFFNVDPSSTVEKSYQKEFVGEA